MTEHQVCLYKVDQRAHLLFEFGKGVLNIALAHAAPPLSCGGDIHVMLAL